jgi:2-aminoethylphosphonate dioxygenase
VTATLIRADEDLAVRFWREGYVLLSGGFESSEIAAWRAESDRLWAGLAADPDDPRVQWRGHAVLGQVRDRIDPLIDISPLFAELACDQRLVAPVRAVLRAEPVLMKAKLIAKRPGTAGYTLHQDFPYWAPLGIPADDLVTLLVSVDRATAENGAVEVFPRLHHAPIPADPDQPLDADETRVDSRDAILAEVEAGGLLLFHSLTPHRSGPNRSPTNRRALFFTYTTTAHGSVYHRYHQHQRVTE